MPKTEHVAQLIRAIGKKDDANARRAVEVMIAHEDSHNNRQAGAALQQALNTWSRMLTPLQPLPYAVQNLVWAEAALRTLNDLALPAAVTEPIQNFLEERRRADRLREAGLPVAHTLLLTGPPGNGKTSLASAVASALDMPFLAGQSHALIDSHLGETSRNVGKLFEYAGQNPVVLFLDELDTLGSHRTAAGASADKEYRSVLTALLMLIDHFPDTSVLVAATNRPDLIDPALMRRFDLVVALPAPSESDILGYLTRYQADHAMHFPVSVAALAHDLAGHPWSTVERTCQQLHKQRILQESATTAVHTSAL
jgi:SpoVK/Ycf46/Vps4 family AAA+-type ATPase